MLATAAATAPARSAEDDSDQCLIARVRAGEDAAFAVLYRRYHRRIAAHIYGMVKDYGRAEDLTQDVFMSALRRMRETDREIVFKPWIYEIAKNACIDQFRRSRRTEEVSFDADEALGAADHRRLAAVGPTPDAAVDQKLALDDLRGAFGGLSPTHHEILVMREFEGLSYSEIGARLGMTRPSVESTLFRARRRLAEEYEELVSGARCVRVQAIVAAAATASLGTRDRRKLAAHVSHCQPCRRHALRAGIDPALMQPRPRTRARVAALLPLPLFLRRRLEEGDTTVAVSHGSTHAAQWSTQLSALADASVAAGWARAVAAAATIAVAGVGAGVATELRKDTSPGSKPAASAPAVAAPALTAASATHRARAVTPSHARASRPAPTAPPSLTRWGGERSPSASGKAGASDGPPARPSATGSSAPAAPAKDPFVTAARKILPTVPASTPAAVAQRPVRRAVGGLLRDVPRAASAALGPVVAGTQVTIDEAGARVDRLIRGG